MKAIAKRQIRTAKHHIIKANEEVIIYRQIGVNNVKLYQINASFGSFTTTEQIVKAYFNFQ